MTPEQINKIAYEYAKEYYNVRGGVDLMTDEARNVIEFVLREHLIVEKEKVERLYGQSDTMYDTHPYDDAIRLEALGKMDVIRMIFPELKTR